MEPTRPQSISSYSKTKISKQKNALVVYKISINMSNYNNFKA